MVSGTETRHGITPAIDQIVPSKHEKEVIEKALEKAAAEKIVRKEIEAGMSATEAFHRYGVL